LKQRRFDEALRWLTFLDEQTSSVDDRPFQTVLHLLAAQSLHRLENQSECARHLLQVDIDVVRHSTELVGQCYHTFGTILSRRNITKQLHDRAERLWSSRRIVSVPLELNDGLWSTFANGVNAERHELATAINHLATTFDVASNPRHIGDELVQALEISGFTPQVDIIEASAREGFDPSSRRVILHLGDALPSGKTLALRCDVPSSPSEAVLLHDVFRLGRAAVALERARRDERKRAALWPSDPIEDDGDALFLAEEMQAVVSTARRVATANIPVLITGETGTGKEVLARLIHSYSPRAAKTFLPFNCTATPREMLDAQLFGHRKGAFTGATENFAGVIRAASGGTLFLDEIGESTLDIQPKLLRFLESGEVHPIGETHPQRADVRVIAATNADVDALVAQGRFREDLFYRLNIVRLQIPPLRERRVEIPSFANHYLQKYAKEMNKGDLRLAEETMEYLVLYRWPGNVRQVANEMRRLAALAEPGAVLMPEHLSADIAASRRTVPASERPLDKNEMVVRLDQPLSAALQHVDRVMVEAAVAKSSSVDEAAKLLGLSRKGLYLKRLRYGMDIDRPKRASGVA
jgi:two-component system NtrC family response regulator/two-component system response regulator AtoC